MSDMLTKVTNSLMKKRSYMKSTHYAETTTCAMANQFKQPDAKHRRKEYCIEIV